MSLGYTIDLIVGDWSDDGHGNTETFTIQSNLLQGALLDAYRKGCEIAGFDITKFCNHWEKKYLPANVYTRLVELGLDVENMEMYEHDDSDDSGRKKKYSVWREDFATIYLFLAQLGDPSFRFDRIHTSSIHIGGYALFN